MALVFLRAALQAPPPPAVHLHDNRRSRSAELQIEVTRGEITTSPLTLTTALALYMSISKFRLPSMQFASQQAGARHLLQYTCVSAKNSGVRGRGERAWISYGPTWPNSCSFLEEKEGNTNVAACSDPAQLPPGTAWSDPNTFIIHNKLGFYILYI